MFNAAFLNSFVEDEADLERRIAIASVHFAHRHINWAFWMCDSFLDRRVQRRAERVFARMGLTLSSELPAMAAETLVTPWRTLPKIEIRPVRDVDSRRAFCEIGAVCFHVPLLWFEEVFDEKMSDRRGEFVAWFAHFLRRTGGHGGNRTGCGRHRHLQCRNPARTSRTGDRGGPGALSSSTRPRKESGIHRTVLQSTSFGYDLYRKMGYRTVGQVLVFTS